MRGGDTPTREQLAQVFHIVAIQHIAVMRVMQETLDAIQSDAKSRAMRGLDVCAQMMQQRLYFAPVDVAADRVMKDRGQ